MSMTGQSPWEQDSWSCWRLGAEGEKVPTLSTGLFRLCGYISLGAKHPDWVIGHVGGEVEDGGHSFANVRMLRRRDEEEMKS